MDFSEFKRRLGAEPRSDDPELLRACESSAEFAAEAQAARQFEDRLERALSLPAPEALVDDLMAIGRQRHTARRGWLPMALAASFVIAVGAAGLIWKMTPSWDSVQDYVVDHYRHDGAGTLARVNRAGPDDVQAMLAAFDVTAAPELEGMIALIKYCPTPDGKGVHMVLKTPEGLITVFYMPGTAVTDREALDFDDVRAVLVELPGGAAAIVAPADQPIEDYYAVVHDSLLPAG
jgi:hypothetical protein